MAVVGTATLAQWTPYRNPALPLVKGVWIGRGNATGDATAGTVLARIQIASKPTLDRYTVEDISADVSPTQADDVIFTVLGSLPNSPNTEDQLIARSTTLIQVTGISAGSPGSNSGMPFMGYPLAIRGSVGLLARCQFETNTNASSYGVYAWGYILDGDLLDALLSTPTTVPATR